MFSKESRIAALEIERDEVVNALKETTCQNKVYHDELVLLNGKVEDLEDKLMRSEKSAREKEQRATCANNELQAMSKHATHLESLLQQSNSTSRQTTERTVQFFD